MLTQNLFPAVLRTGYDDDNATLIGVIYRTTESESRYGSAHVSVKEIYLKPEHITRDQFCDMLSKRRNLISREGGGIWDYATEYLSDISQLTPPDISFRVN